MLTVVVVVFVALASILQVRASPRVLIVKKSPGKTGTSAFSKVLRTCRGKFGGNAACVCCFAFLACCLHWLDFFLC